MTRLPVLMYHHVGVPPAEARLKSLYVHPRTFRGHLRYLRLAGFNGITCEQAVGYVRSGVSLPPRAVALTFDDGYRDFEENALPLLRRYGFPATVFVVTGEAGGFNRWDEEEVGVRKHLLGREDLRRMSDDSDDGGVRVEFGSHTVSHPFLSKLDTRSLSEELAESRRTLETWLGKPVRTLCYPYGDCDDRVARAAEEAGYAGAWSVSRGFVTPGDDPFRLKRVRISRNTYLPLFILKLHSNYEVRRGAREER